MAVVPAVTSVRTERAVGLPNVPLPRVPESGLVWGRAVKIALVLCGLVGLDQLANLLMQYWFMQSLGFASVFWKNFTVGAILFGVALATYGAAIVVPAYVHGLDRAARRRAIWIGILVGLIAGYFESRHYPDYLLFIYGKHWGHADPIFHHDIGFYVFKLPAISHTVFDLWRLALVALAASLFCAWRSPARSRLDPHAGRPARVIARLATPYTLGLFVAVGLLMAVEDWLRRFGLLYKSNPGKGIPSGGSNVDVGGLWSTKNALLVEAIVAAVATLALAYRLRAVRLSVLGHRARPVRRSLLSLPVPAIPRLRTRWVLAALIPALALDFGFKAMVGLRNITQTIPNEPLVQLPFIKDHITATNAAYNLDAATVSQFVPKQTGDPNPPVNSLVNSPAIANATLWPGLTTWLKRIPDPAHANRPFLQNPPVDARVDTTVLSPTLATYQQQQKLRPYYNFLNTRTVRYYVRESKGGPPVERIFATSVRELPLIEPKPWLAWWGQRFVIFTHGWGFVANEAQQVSATGEPVYASSSIPIRNQYPELAAKNPGIYYGEGSGSMAYTNLHGIKEHDYPTPDGRAQVAYSPGVKAGVTLDSPLKRIVFGYKSRQLLDIFFSRLLKPWSRVHYFRQPLDRLDHVAPFLYYDSAPYAVTNGNSITWMINGMATSSMYPYSRFTMLGDDGSERTFLPHPPRRVNYARDSVKVTMDAYTGQVHLYKWADDPVIDTYAAMYPKLFRPKSAMPPALRQQVQYPSQLAQVQMLDVFRYSHMTNPLTFYANEDKWDQAKQVTGPLVTEGQGVTFPLEPWYWLATPGQNGMPPAHSPTQFSMSMAFTPANNQNLRALGTVYMDGPDYGRMSFLEIPKGHYALGPEQAESAIDQDPFISQQTHLWERRGLEIIHGQMLPLLANGELIYVQPWFIRSKQNPLPRLKRIMVVYRGRPNMALTLPTAVHYAVLPFAQFQTRGGPELGGEPVFVRCTKHFCPRL
jgi:uncharacterized membrane protein (UPF0182 family)